MKTSLSRARLIGAVGLVAVTGASYFFIVAPRLTQAQEITQMTNATIDKRAALEQQIRTLERRQDYLAQAQAEVARLANKYPNDSGVPALMAEINLAAMSAGLDPGSQVLSVITGKPVLQIAEGADGAAAPDPSADPAAAAAAASTATMDVQIVAQGSLDQLSRFLATLRKGSRALLLSKAVIGSQANYGQTTTATLYRVTINASAVLMPPVPPVPDSVARLTDDAGEATPTTTATPSPMPTPSAATPTATPTDSATPTASATAASSETPTETAAADGTASPTATPTASAAANG